MMMINCVNFNLYSVFDFFATTLSFPDSARPPSYKSANEDKLKLNTDKLWLSQVELLNRVIFDFCPKPCPSAAP